MIIRGKGDREDIKENEKSKPNNTAAGNKSQCVFNNFTSAGSVAAVAAENQ